MEEITAKLDYERVARAIEYLKANFKRQPDLAEVAEEVNLSPFHFQRLFSNWAGVSPKKFLQYLSLEYAKEMLGSKASLFEASLETGLSGPSRLHDLFVSIEGMTPGEYRNGGQSLLINYSFYQTPFGDVLVGSTAKGICYLTFPDSDRDALSGLKSSFPQATYQEQSDELQQRALQVFDAGCSGLHSVKLHLKGTPFQLKVWQALLNIPPGKLVTYSSICADIKNEKACRAVGSAVGSNPIAYLIPCHRVIRSTGESGQYRWGATRKLAMIGWEASQQVIRDDREV